MSLPRSTSHNLPQNIGLVQKSYYCLYEVVACLSFLDAKTSIFIISNDTKLQGLVGSANILQPFSSCKITGGAPTVGSLQPSLTLMSLSSALLWELHTTVDGGSDDVPGDGRIVVGLRNDLGNDLCTAEPEAFVVFQDREHGDLSRGQDYPLSVSL